jgi:hypothetical protein
VAGRRLKVRLKLIDVGGDQLLFVRFVPFNDSVRKELGQQLQDGCEAGTCSSDGEVFTVRGQRSIATAWALLRASCEAVYDPNLSRGHVALPNPWKIPSIEKRDWTRKLRSYMALVRHPDLGEALAFQSPEDDDDFLIDFRQEFTRTWRWIRFCRDLDAKPVWVVAEYYADRAHEVADRYYDCWWDEFLAGEEWDILPPPTNTGYPVRTLTDADFGVLEVPPYCSLEELNAAYGDKKADYLDNQIPVDEWLDIDAAYQRIRRHHFPQRAEHPTTVVAPRHILELLRSAISDEDLRVKWFHSYCAALGSVPATLITEADGEERITHYLRMLSAFTAGAGGRPAT